MFSIKHLSAAFCLCAALLFAEEALPPSSPEIAIVALDCPDPVAFGLNKKEPVLPQQPCCQQENATSHLQFGGSYTHLRIQPNKRSNYNGNLVGAQGLYEFRAPDRIYGGAMLRWRQGKETSAQNSMIFTDWNAQERIGYTVGNRNNLFSLFTGFGFRFLQHDMKEMEFYVSEYRYEQFYVPVGFAYDYKFSSCFSWGLYATWMPQVYSSVVEAPMGGVRWALERTFKNGIVEMPFTFGWERFETVSIILKPFAEYWQDGELQLLHQPRNTYLFVGADLNICFSF